MSLPDAILNYIVNLTVENLSPAYILVDKSGHILSYDGDLKKYGINNLNLGELVENQVIFLKGLLPLDSPTTFIPCLTIESNQTADVHLFSCDEGDCILLLDATLDQNVQFRIQQKINDLSLLRRKYSKLLDQCIEKDTTQNLIHELMGSLELEQPREITILLASFLGFIDYSESTSSKVAIETLDASLATIAQPILDEGGLISNIFGHTVMALFGVLPSVQLPSLQAVQASFRILELVNHIPKPKQSGDLSDLQLGIGIASGPVSMGVIHAGTCNRLSAVGRCVDVAMQLKNHIHSSELLVDDNTFSRLEHLKKHFSRSFLLTEESFNSIQVYSYRARS